MGLNLSHFQQNWFAIQPGFFIGPRGKSEDVRQTFLVSPNLCSFFTFRRFHLSKSNYTKTPYMLTWICFCKLFTNQNHHPIEQFMALQLRLFVIAWNKAIKAAAYNHTAKLFVELEKGGHELRFELCPKIPLLEKMPLCPDTRQDNLVSIKRPLPSLEGSPFSPRHGDAGLQNVICRSRLFKNWKA